MPTTAIIQPLGGVDVGIPTVNKEASQLQQQGSTIRPSRKSSLAKPLKRRPKTSPGIGKNASSESRQKEKASSVTTMKASDESFKPAKVVKRRTNGRGVSIRASRANNTLDGDNDTVQKPTTRKSQSKLLQQQQNDSSKSLKVKRRTINRSSSYNSFTSNSSSSTKSSNIGLNVKRRTATNSKPTTPSSSSATRTHTRTRTRPVGSGKGTLATSFSIEEEQSLAPPSTASTIATTGSLSVVQEGDTTTTNSNNGERDSNSDDAQNKISNNNDGVGVVVKTVHTVTMNKIKKKSPALLSRQNSTASSTSSSKKPQVSLSRQNSTASSTSSSKKPQVLLARQNSTTSSTSSSTKPQVSLARQNSTASSTNSFKKSQEPITRPNSTTSSTSSSSSRRNYSSYKVQKRLVVNTNSNNDIKSTINSSSSNNNSSKCNIKPRNNLNKFSPRPQTSPCNSLSSRNSDNSIKEEQEERKQILRPASAPVTSANYKSAKYITDKWNSRALQWRTKMKQSSKLSLFPPMKDYTAKLLPRQRSVGSISSNSCDSGKRMAKKVEDARNVAKSWRDLKVNKSRMTEERSKSLSGMGWRDNASDDDDHIDDDKMSPILPTISSSDSRLFTISSSKDSMLSWKDNVSEEGDNVEDKKEQQALITILSTTSSSSDSSLSYNDNEDDGDEDDEADSVLSSSSFDGKKNKPPVPLTTTTMNQDESSTLYNHSMLDSIENNNNNNEESPPILFPPQLSLPTKTIISSLVKEQQEEQEEKKIDNAATTFTTTTKEDNNNKNNSNYSKKEQQSTTQSVLKKSLKHQKQNLNPNDNDDALQLPSPTKSVTFDSSIPTSASSNTIAIPTFNIKTTTPILPEFKSSQEVMSNTTNSLASKSVLPSLNIGNSTVQPVPPSLKSIASSSFTFPATTTNNFTASSSSTTAMTSISNPFDLFGEETTTTSNSNTTISLASKSVLPSLDIGNSTVQPVPPSLKSTATSSSSVPATTIKNSTPSSSSTIATTSISNPFDLFVEKTTTTSTVNPFDAFGDESTPPKSKPTSAVSVSSSFSSATTPTTKTTTMRSTTTPSSSSLLSSSSKATADLTISPTSASASLSSSSTSSRKWVKKDIPFSFHLITPSTWRKPPTSNIGAYYGGLTDDDDNFDYDSLKKQCRLLYEVLKQFTLIMKGFRGKDSVWMTVGHNSGDDCWIKPLTVETDDSYKPSSSRPNTSRSLIKAVVPVFIKTNPIKQSKPTDTKKSNNTRIIENRTHHGREDLEMEIMIRKVFRKSIQNGDFKDLQRVVQ